MTQTTDMSNAIFVDPNDYDQEAWKVFFSTHPEVRSVLVDTTEDNEIDVTVYYKDSSEPFPISSLNPDSSIVVDLQKVCYN